MDIYVFLWIVVVVLLFVEWQNRVKKYGWKRGSLEMIGGLFILAMALFAQSKFGNYGLAAVIGILMLIVVVNLKQPSQTKTPSAKPGTVEELFDLVQYNNLPGYSEGAQMALASALVAVVNTAQKGINWTTQLIAGETLHTIYMELADQGREDPGRLIWAIKTPSGNPTEEAMTFIDNFGH